MCQATTVTTINKDERKEVSPSHVVDPSSASMENINIWNLDVWRTQHTPVNIMPERALELINEDKNLTTEEKEQYAKMLKYSPNPSLTAEKVCEEAAQGGLKAFIEIVRAGIDFIRTGGRGRPSIQSMG